MMVLPSPVPDTASLEVRRAVSADQQKIADLIFFESHVHRHLDWRAPLDWLGQFPFWVVEENGRMLGALACPPDPVSISWIRLFAFATHLAGHVAWQVLWIATRQELAESGGATVAAIATQGWLDEILSAQGFDLSGRIVLLEWNGGPRLSGETIPGLHLRLMVSEDLPQVAEVDSAAFAPLWQNSLESLTRAYRLASHAVIAEDPSGVVGYQLSTAGAFGTHLARLAVRPEAQGRGVGTALVRDLIDQVSDGGEARVTVNTQSNNAASLALYDRLGFRRTGEQYPVYTMDVR